ncbi:hypothetical protein SAMN04489717_3119 [Actinopolymorpha singaporensis]|uniref:Reverse transcriptase domain-containing protein n=1 Tax=Actinopolymorpha singaporensis TaxID=117157 RepID=A0A1H1T9Z9_9ACTN|nr:hypothetical protein SAMN04489717_3119 [Actinopolymorpha singaporensis]
MEAVPVELLDELDLVAAARAEAQATRNLLPPEAWQEVVGNHAQDVADWVRTRLRAGRANSPSVVVSASKGSWAVRPVPVLGIAERVAYRALTDHILKRTVPLDRSPESYAKFLTGPIQYGHGNTKGLRRLGDSPISHILGADIAAFYQYVDHQVLRQELALQTGMVEETDFLMYLLEEVQGASYGIPQLLDSSDSLSEVYVRIVERDVVRRGLKVWRFNDDFHIGVASYAESRDAIDVLSEAARRVGLNLNESKTYVKKFSSYVLDHLGVSVDSDTPVGLEDVEAALADDYSAGDPQAAIESAVETINSISTDNNGDGRINLHHLGRGELRELKRALGVFTRERDVQALDLVPTLYVFVPPLTPLICNYLVAVNDQEGDRVAQIWDSLTSDALSTVVSEWQSAWLVYVSRVCGLLAQPQRADWVRRQKIRQSGGLLHAEASLALATIGSASFDELDMALRMQSEAFAPWYVLGIRALNEAAPVGAERVNAVKGSSPLYRILLEA